MNIKMKELPISERPYEKLEMYGAQNLTNSELLAIIIKTGTKDDTAIGLAQKVLKLNDGTNKEDLSFLQDISIVDLKKIKGIGRVKAVQLLAVCELAKRINKPINKQNIKINNSNDVAKLLMNELRYEKREKAKLVLLNGKNIIIKIVDISYGGNNFAMIEPKEILNEAVKIGAPKMILVHNHPSGDVKPSKSDFKMTDRIYEASELLGIKFLDHIIIGNNKFESIFGAKEELL
jgi:DNA repair protein RadC